MVLKTFKMSEELEKKLKEIAKEETRTQTGVLTLALEQYIERNKK